MKIIVDFSKLQALADALGKQKVDFSLESKEQVFEPLDIELSGDGVQIDPSEIEVIDGLLSYKGRQVLLYIKDHSRNYDKAIIDGKDGNKFHVAHCKTLQEMIHKNRYERYVATNNLSGNFKISASNRPEKEVKLWVCQNCLELLNYKKSREHYTIKRNNAATFNVKEFFATYSSNFKYMPKYKDNVDIGYVANWDSISQALRSQHNYTCSSCTINLSTEKFLCHVHHRNGVKQDNSKENLQVLCADCHRKAHDGAMHLKHSDMKIINKLRAQQGILRFKDWDAVFNLVDPAIHGALDVMKRKGYKAPQIAYTINHHEVEAVWPEKHQGISIEPLSISGWDIYQPIDILKD